MLLPPDARPGPRPPGEVCHPVPPDGGGLAQLQPPEQPVSPQPASGQRRVVRVSLVQGILMGSPDVELASYTSLFVWRSHACPCLITSGQVAAELRDEAAGEPACRRTEIFSSTGGGIVTLHRSQQLVSMVILVHGMAAISRGHNFVEYPKAGREGKSSTLPAQAFTEPIMSTLAAPG